MGLSIPKYLRELKSELFGDGLVCLFHKENWITGEVEETVEVERVKQRFDYLKREERLTKMMELISSHVLSQSKCQNTLVMTETRLDMEEII